MSGLVGEAIASSLSPVERLVRRDRAVTGAALGTIIAAAWLSLLRVRTEMTGAAPTVPGMAMAMPETAAWSAADLAALFVMWAVMMAAMMLPSAAPMILLFASVHRRRRARDIAVAPTAVFAAGYLVVWTAFSAVASLIQWALHQSALLSPAMASTSPLLGGLILIVAGVYQWLPLKSACLGRCRSPLGFLGSEWREGTGGALVMGLRHGLFCLGCCWALMLLLFVAGVMSLLWIALIAGMALVEKFARSGPWVGRIAGLALVAWGIWLAGFGP